LKSRFISVTVFPNAAQIYRLGANPCK